MTKNKANAMKNNNKIILKKKLQKIYNAHRIFNQKQIIKIHIRFYFIYIEL